MSNGDRRLGLQLRSTPATHGGRARAARPVVVGRRPDFLVAGAAKSGTTSLARHLALHPGVFVAAEKELHYFCGHSRREWDWYTDRFSAAAPDAVAGEATPDYLWRPRVMEQIACDLPDVRIIAMLRHPVDRAYSQYWHRRAIGDHRAFEEAVFDPDLDAAVGYLARGRYADQLERAYALFPREHVHVVLFDDFVADTDAVTRATFDFLGVDRDVPLPGIDTAHNRRFRIRSTGLRTAMVRHRAWQRWPFLAAVVDRWNHVPVTTIPMAPATRARLLEEFAPDTQRLERLLGRRLPNWYV